ncbi:hypothetical protein [Companilactobacillus mishanensis]|uniref:hypothetical protein n=1 Tax=Companilactobacillus mishanensis TaxID=2486008 RepID=UPI000F79F1EE|nr:hypothetical protein [Companilactobacillus mishanensis]
MKLKKALISSSFAIAIALTGITVASGTANADTTNNTNTTGDAYVTTQVAPQNVSTSTDAAQTATDANRYNKRYRYKRCSNFCYN